MANLFLMSGDSHCDASGVLLGVADLLTKAGRTIGFFRPITGNDSSDPHFALLQSRFALPFGEDESSVLSLHEALDLLNARRQTELFERILDRARRLEAKCDVLLCEGAPLTESGAPFIFDLNSDLAANLNASIVLLNRGSGTALGGRLRLLSRKKLDPVCVFTAAENQQALAALQAEAHASADLPMFSFPLERQETGAPACGFEDGKTDAVLTRFAETVDEKALLRRLDSLHSERTTPAMFQSRLLNLARQHRMRIVLPEGEEERILHAADETARRKAADVILLGRTRIISEKAAALGLELSGVKIIDPCTAPEFEDYAQTYAELRRKKGVTLEQAREKMADTTYFGTMMVYKDHADGMVSGAVHTTAHTIRPAFEFIKTKPGFTNVSSVFFMCLEDRVLVFGDCAVNPNPTPEQLAETAVVSAHTARVFGVEPRVAMLSYSTGTSGKGPDVEAVIEATRLARERAPELALDGPLQYDAAVSPETARTKLPDSPVAGKATVFIFPDLNAGNITYKAVQRAASAIAVGPVLQGLNKPVNDLSRGCLIPDIVNTVIITAIQAQADKGLL